MRRFRSSRLRILLLTALLGLALAAAMAWLFRVQLLLAGVGFLAQMDHSPEPARPLIWQTPEPDVRTVADASQRPPNIVLILADDLGWNDVSVTGGSDATLQTPNIDAIAASGVTFTHGYAANATCAPSRAALMSGRYATRFGFEFTPTPPGMMPMLRIIGEAADVAGPPAIYHSAGESLAYEDMGMPSEEVTLAELFQDQGYHTVHIGKWHLGLSGDMAPEHQGFDESLLMFSGLYGRTDDAQVVESRQEFDPIDRFLWRAMSFAARFNSGPAFEPPGYLTDYYSREAVRVIEANRDRPFFLYLAHWAPHTPLQATRADYDALAHIPSHRERVYAAMIRALDRGVGQVLEALKRTGLDDNTLVVFTSDNGGAGYLGLPRVNQPFRGWKMSLFEGGIRVPFLARWPGHIRPGSAYDQPVHHFDIFATAAAAAGAELPRDRKIDGVNLLPYLQGETAGPPHQALFWQSGAARSMRMGRYKLNVSAPDGLPRQEWLFDLRSDPGERQDLSADLPEQLDRMRAALAAHRAEQSPPRWPSRMSSPVNVDRALSRTSATGNTDTYAYWSN